MISTFPSWEGSWPIKWTTLRQWWLSLGYNEPYWPNSRDRERRYVHVLQDYMSRKICGNRPKISAKLRIHIWKILSDDLVHSPLPILSHLKIRSLPWHQVFHQARHSRTNLASELTVQVLSVGARKAGNRSRAINDAKRFPGKHFSNDLLHRRGCYVLGMMEPYPHYSLWVPTPDPILRGPFTLKRYYFSTCFGPWFHALQEMESNVKTRLCIASVC